MKTIFALLLLVILPACVSVSNSGSRVQVVQSPPPNARFLARVSYTSALSGAFESASYENALRGAINKAGEIGATHLVLDPDCSPKFWGFRQDVRGNAYAQP